MFLYHKKKFIKFSYNFSTHLLTVLTISGIVISEIEQYCCMKSFYLPTLTIVNFYYAQLVVSIDTQEGRRNPYEHSKIYTKVNRGHQWL